MNIPCNQAVRCVNQVNPGANLDFPMANFSSEGPDVDLFIGTNYGWGNNQPPLGTTWWTPGCQAWCQSSISQEDADLCAARQQLLCLTNNPPDVPVGSDGTSNPEGPGGLPPGGGGPGSGAPGDPGQPTKPGLFYNTLQSCDYDCGNGQKFTDSIAAGQVAATSQVQADTIAKSLACNNAQKKAVCLTKLSGFACADPFFEDPEYSFQFVSLSQSPPVKFTASGGLPPQLVLESTGLLHGTPDTAGDYNFDVTATDALGNTQTTSNDFHVLGLDISSKDLPRVAVDHPYTYQMNGKGGAINYYIIDGSLPHGLTMDELGLITGTPDTVQKSSFTVNVVDAFGHECAQELRLEVHGPKFNPPFPGNGTQCSAYGYQFNATPAGCTFSGSVPDGTSMTALGLVTGTPATHGSQSFSVTATDPATGDTNTYSATITIAADGTGISKSLNDTGVWAETVISEGNGSSHSGTITKGNGVVTFNIPANWSLGTERVRYQCSLGRCAATAPYNLSWSLNLNYSQPAMAPPGQNIIQAITLALCGSLVHASGGTEAGFSDGGIVAVTSPGSLLNCSLDVQFNGAFRPNSFTGIITLTITPLTPP